MTGDELAALRAGGRAAMAAGDAATARRCFADVLAIVSAAHGADDARTLTALSDFGAACAAAGDFGEAQAAHERALTARRRVLGDAHQDVAASLHNLASVSRSLRESAAAEAHQAEALAIWQATLGEDHPVLAKAHGALAVLMRERGDAAGAVAHARRALDVRQLHGDPQVAGAWDALAVCQMQAGDFQGASDSWLAALTLLQAGGAAPVRQAPLLHRLGVVRRRQRDLAGALGYFEDAVRADAAYVPARHDLAATLTRLGRADDAKPHRDIALQRQCVFVQRAAAGLPSVLILSLADDGNIPLEHVLPEGELTRIWWFIAHSRDPSSEALPAYDVVLNAIGDADMSGDADPKVAAFLRGCTRPVLNDPARVARTRRDQLPDLLAGLADVVVPEVRRVDDARSFAGLPPPLLVRPAGSHGGAGLVRIDDVTDVNVPASSVYYASTFHDYRSPDGYYRKYRMIFVAGRPLPYHLAISPDWLVHYVTADMPAHAWKLAEEARFLEDPRGALGERAYDAVVAIGERVGLDYGGLDFSVLADGRVLVFEANATMLVHPEAEGGPLAFKNAAVARIKAAFCKRVNEAVLF